MIGPVELNNVVPFPRQSGTAQTAATQADKSAPGSEPRSLASGAGAVSASEGAAGTPGGTGGDSGRDETDKRAADLTERAQALLERLSRSVDGNSSKLRIQQDENTGKIVYLSVDGQSGEVLRQWPREEVLRMMSFMRSLQGLVVNEQV